MYVIFVYVVHRVLTTETLWTESHETDSALSLLYLHFVQYVRGEERTTVLFPIRHCALLHAWNSGWQTSIRRPPKPCQISFITKSESILIKSRNRCPRSFFMTNHSRLHRYAGNRTFIGLQAYL